MKHVKQQDPNGCGLACVAMVAGDHVTYEMARSVWLNKCHGDIRRILAGGDGLRIYEVMDLGHLFGIKTWPLMAPAIVQVRSRSNQNNWHYVVVTEDGTILDPALDD